jgi:AraC-like DNA-binding protein
MNRTLSQIQDWSQLAQQANWSVKAMAERCGVSESTLRRHFIRTMGKTTKKWISDQRQKQAIELLKDGSSIKETAMQLGFQHPNNFTREFRKYWGKHPSGILSAPVR